MQKHHFPVAIAGLYDPENVPADLCAAHERNDEVSERSYVSCRFKSDTKRLERPFELSARMAVEAAKMASAKVG